MVRIEHELSLVVLTCNRPRDLELSVRSVLSQSILPGELILVDDGPTDPTSIQRAVETAGIHFVYHRKERRGISRSRNIGADLARGELVMYLDDDERMEPGYIAAILDLFHGESGGTIIAAAGRRLGHIGSEPGRMDPLWHFLERFFLLRSTDHRILRSGFSSPAWESFTTVTDVEFLSGTATYRRSLFWHHQFDEDLERFGSYAFGEDLAFSFKIRAEGRRVVTPRASVRHHRSSTSKPHTAEMARLRLHNQYYIYSRYLKGNGATPLAFGWALLGKLVLGILRFASHPAIQTWGQFKGTLSGTVLVMGMALRGRQVAPEAPDRSV
ncbi:MAG: glycosyltransferase family 2 protein [Acidobacteriota bacterium]